MSEEVKTTEVEVKQKKEHPFAPACERNEKNNGESS